MKTFKRILASFMVVVMMLTATPLSGFVGLELPNLFNLFASAATYSGTCGDNLTWTFDGSTGELSITGTGAMYDYSYNNRPWESYEDNIKSVVIGNSVTTIGNYAFAYCGSLTSVTIGNSVTTIGDDAFCFCESLTSVTIPDSVTTIGKWAYRSCDSLTSVTIPDSVTTIGHMAFYDCDSLTSVTIPDSVTAIGDYAFGCCYSLTSVTIPDSVTTIGDYAFCNCYSLTSVTIPDSVTTISDSAFYDCTSLTGIVVDADNQYYSSDSYGVLYNKGKTELIQYPIGNERISFSIPDSVTTIGYVAFYDCDSLISVTIGNSVTTIGDWAFFYCDSLTSITIPDSVTTIGALAFGDCSSLTSVTIGNSVTGIGVGVFSSCDSLTSVTIPDSVTTIGDHAFSSCDSLTSVTIGNSVTTIGDDAFASCISLTSITIPDSVTTIRYGAFSDCDSLTSITIGNSVTTIEEYVFDGCDDLTDVYYNGTQEQWSAISIGSENAPLTSATFHFNECSTCGDNLTWTFDISTGELSITGTGDMDDYAYGEAPWYSYRYNIKNVTIESGITSIGDYAFRSCENVASVTIPEGVKSIGDYAFDNCKVLKNLTTPESLVDIGDHAFANSGLENISISAGVKSIDNNAFAGCIDLENISVDSQNTEYSSDENGVLFNKDKTTLILYPANHPRTDYTVPDSVTVISSYAFDAASNLTSVTINKGVTEIGTGAFNDCVNLETTYYKGNERRWGTISISSLNDYLTGNVVFLITGKDVIDSGSCGENLVWNMYDNGELIITGTGDMYDFDVGGAPWKSYSSTIKSVIIENGVTSIGTYAFFCYKSVTSVTIGDSVTSIGNYAFEWCDSLASITIGNGVTDIGVYAFGYCSNLTSVTIPDSVTTIGSSAFTKCSSLTNITIPDSVIIIGSDVFSGCGNLTSVTIGNNVTTIGNYAFYNCNSLTSVTIPDSVTTIGTYAFSDCTGITDITIPDSVTTIGDGAFADCTSLTDITIPDSVTAIGNDVFRGCKSITSIIIPDSVTKFGAGCFDGCSSLQSVTIGKGVTNLNKMFEGCTSLESLYLPIRILFVKDVFAEAINLKDIYYAGNIHQWRFISGLNFCGLDSAKTTVHFADSNSFDDHTFVVTNTIPATCLEDGLNEYKCDCGEFYSEVIPVTGHSYTAVVIDPTCTSDGYTVHTCSACGDSYTDSEIIASGHDYYQNVIVPSCTESGYTINTCRHCNDVYVSEQKPAAGHKYTTVVINPTCVNEGYTLGACDVCGAAAITDKKPALGHEYIEQVTPATCEAEGYTTYTCTRGDHIYIDDQVSALGHSYEKTVFLPTCIQDGCTFNICNTCGKLHKSDIVPATGHSFGSWRVIVQPSENKEGFEERYCKYCHYTEERTLPMTLRTAYTVTFVADGKTVAVVEYLKDATTVNEPAVPHKDRYTGKWESYSLNNSDIVVNAKYELVSLNSLSGVSNDKTAAYNAETGIASVTLTASSDAKTVITQSKERVPLDIVLVVDQSGSMNSNLGGRYSKKDSLIDSTYDFVDMVYDDAKSSGIDHRLAIVGFGMGSKASGTEYPAYLNTEILTTGRRPLGVQYATKEDYKNALMSVNQNGVLNGGITTAINSIDANGATAADYGLSMASSIFANNPIAEGENRQRIVVFISDGEPTYSSAFEVDVANAAIQEAHKLKNTHNATVYSVSVMTESEAKNEKLNAFLSRVSSNYNDARNIFGNATKETNQYYLNIDDTDNLSAMFGEIVTENITQTTDFDNVTIVDTISEYFTMTSQQEKEFRLKLINEYGVKNSDISVVRNEDGTTSIRIDNIRTKPVEVGGKTKYGVTVSYDVSANEKANAVGSYPICTDDSGIIIGNNDCYERTFPVMNVNVPAARKTVVFKVNGDVYALKTVLPGAKVTAPSTDFIGEYEFSGWDIPVDFVAEQTLTEFDSVLIQPEYVIVWNTESGSQKVTYSPGDLINEPEVAPNANGAAFNRWNRTVPVQMPTESLEFTAVYGDHEHLYYTETETEVSCLHNGKVNHICEICGDSYSETIEAPGEHYWKAIAKPGDKHNDSSAYFECERCGICADKHLNYIITENEPNERGHFDTLIYEYNYVDEDGNLYQPDGEITIVSTVEEYFDGADDVKVYRLDENGNKIECSSDYENGVITFETNHFSTYVFEPYYSCQSTGEHGDADGDGYCDRCDNVLKEFIDFIVKEGIDAEIDSEYRLLLGNDVLNYSAEDVADLFEFGNIFVEEKETGKIGTGDIICLTNDNGEVSNKLTVIIFGDVNGDGWYDGTDSIIVSCLANGLLTKESVSEAAYMAADCNHDGTIDAFDVALLEQAGLLLAAVDQSKSADELVSDAGYIEYLGLIDQTPGTEDDEIPEQEDSDEEGSTDAEIPAQGEEEISIIDLIINIIKSIITKIFSLIPVPYQ